MDRPFKSLVRILEERGRTQPGEMAYTFLGREGEVEATIGYCVLHKRARAIGELIQQHASPGDRVLLLYPPGLEYIAAFIGCLYARTIAVPAYPPQGSRGMGRLQSIAQDATPVLGLVDSSVLKRIETVREQPAFLSAMKIANTESIDFSMLGEMEWQPVLDPGPDQIALLQYTSGSLGNPKGVAITHANLISNQEMIREAFGHGPSTRICSWLPPYHDMGLIGTIMQPIFLGAPCFLMSPRSFLEKPIRWLKAISQYRVTTSGAPNFGYDLCVEKIDNESMAELELSSWNLAFNGAEPVRARTIERFAKRFRSTGFRKSAFYPCYGLAEATLLVSGGGRSSAPTIRTFDKASLAEQQAVRRKPGEALGQELVSCGKAVGQRVLIVDPICLRECPSDAIGEIWVSGPNVAAGYWSGGRGKTELFSACLADSGKFEWLRTGDLGFLHDGELYVVGRLKDVIIVRGRNFYPADLEQNAVASFRGLRLNATAAFGVDGSEGERLVIVQEIEHRFRESAGDAAKAIMGSIAQANDIAPYDVAVVKPGNIPLTSSGKVRRQLCRQLYLDGKLERWDGGRSLGDMAPAPLDGFASRFEREIAAIWKELLKVDSLDRRSSFFELGGDSLAAAQNVVAIEERLLVAADPDLIFEKPILADYAGALEAYPRISESGRTHRQDTELEGIPSATHALSAQQSRIWYLARLDPDQVAYHVPIAIRLTGRLDEACFERCFQEVVAVHESLRSTLSDEAGEPCMIVHATLPAGYERIDLTALDESRKGERLKEIERENASQPFDLKFGPLLRAALVRVTADEWHLFLTVHHLIADGWSLTHLFRQIAQAYRPGGEVPRCQRRYRDYVVRQSASVRRRRFQEDIQWWKERLQDAEPLRLPTDFPEQECITRSWENDDFENRYAALTLSHELCQTVHGLARRSQTTPFVVLLTTFKLLLSRLSGQERICVGFPAANRVCVDDAETIGLFTNTLASLTDFSGTPTFAAVLAREATAHREALSRQSTPLEAIIDAIRPDRTSVRSPIFQVFFNLLNLPIEDPGFSGMTTELLREPVWGGKFDLSLYAREREGSLRLTLVHDQALFRIERVREMLEQYRLLLRQVTADPDKRVGDYSLLSDRAANDFLFISEPLEEDRLLQPPFKLFERQAMARPRALAVVDGDNLWTYGDLETRANRLAHRLIGCGVKRGDVVAIYANRSAWLPCAILGIHKAGAAFAILDAAYPALRLADQLSVSRASAVVALESAGAMPVTLRQCIQGSMASALIVLGASSCLEGGSLSMEPIAAPEVAVDGSDLAYVAFTSGTTGLPLAIEGTHAPLSHFLGWYLDLVVGDSSGDPCGARFSMLSGLSHDPLLRDIFSPLCSGAQLRIPRQALYDSPAALSNWLVAERVSHVHLTPSLWDFVSAGVNGSVVSEGLRWAVFAGEPLTGRHLASFKAFAPFAKAINGYGTTETPQLASYFLPDERYLESSTRAVPLGRGAGGAALLVVGTGGQIAGLGELGEICVRSSYLAQGYRTKDAPVRELESRIGVNGEELFLYRTGDLGRYELDGAVSFVCRSDDQISLRGFRIEPAEIESAARSLAGVKSCKAIWAESRAGKPAVTVYYSAVPELSEETLLSHLLDRLPSHMVPSHFARVDALPLTPNGKVDQSKLPPLESMATEPRRMEPNGETERVLAAIWQRILGTEGLDMEDDFFRAGGSSIDAAKVVMAVERELSVSVSLKEFFRRRTIARLAKWIENERWLSRAATETAAEFKEPSEEREVIIL